MKKFQMFLILVLFLTAQSCFAKDLKILVLTDSILNKYEDALIYPESSEIVSNDVINYLNIAPGLNAPTTSFIKKALNNDIKTTKYMKKALTDFKINYSIDFEMLKALNYRYKADLILLLTVNLDEQNYFLRRTLWDFLNIPGATVIDPAIRVSTQAYLVNPKTNIIVWQQNYQKLISSRESRIIPNNFAPQTEQLERLKLYSTKFLAPQITQEIQLALYKVDEYTDMKKIHPEIVKPATLYTDSLEITGRRAAVRAGRATRAEAKKTAKKIKTNTNNFIEKQKQNAKIRKEKSLIKKQERIKAKAAAKAKKEAEKKLQEQPVTTKTLEQNSVNAPDVIIIREEQKLDTEFVPTKPRLRDDTNNYTINDL